MILKNGMVITQSELEGNYTVKQLKAVICRKCKSVVAHSDGEHIYFGPRPVPNQPKRIDYLCPVCKAEAVWKQDERDLGMVK